ncbi:DUF6894 family protein [Methylobacterium sp. A54F]
MARYRFHCINGLECVFDAIGADIRAPGRLPGKADEVARRVMERLEDRSDWAAWQVSVHDLKGRRVLLRPFTGNRTGERARAA